MGNFQGRDNRGGGFRGGNGGGGRPSFGGKPSFGGNRGGGDRGPVTMHKAVCDECHKPCEVPFLPSSDKPIYCNDCFGEKRGNEAPRRDFNDRGPKKDFGSKPSFSKPAQQAPSGEDVKRQLSEMNSKLDRLVIAIEKLTTPMVSAFAATSKLVSKVSPVAAKKVEVKKTIASKAPIAKVSPKKVVAKTPAKKVVTKKGKK